ncbi:MAG: hypothetical protein AAFO69_12875 [Bacteroidota bacterium]
MKTTIKALLIFSFFLSSTIGFSQERIPVSLQNHSFSINFLSPGLQYEAKIAENKSLVFSGGLSTSVGWDGFNGFSTMITPMIGGEYRSYYNRKQQKKSLRGNSGNYVGGIIGFQLNELADERSITFNSRLSSGAIWGMQRRYQSGFQLGIQAGAVMTYDDFFGFGADVVARVQLGWVIK